MMLMNSLYAFQYTILSYLEQYWRATFALKISFKGNIYCD